MTKPRARKTTKRYSDVHSFKLTANESLWRSTAVSGSSYVKTTGPSIVLGNIVQTPGLNVVRFGGVARIQADSTTQWSQLNTLFDRYKINGVKYTFIPEFNFNSTSSLSTIPVIKFVHDYDDAVVPQVGDVWARQGKEYRLTRPVSIYVKPKVSLGVFNYAASNTYGVTAKAPYLNSAFDQIPHFGLKFAVKDWPSDASAVTQYTACRVEVTYYMTLREQINISAAGHTGEEDGITQELNDGQQQTGVAEPTACELRPV